MPASRLLNDLEAALREAFELRRADDVAAFRADGLHARYIVEPKLRLAAHFDLEPAIAILDPVLGTFGIVETVPPTGGAAAGVEKLVERYVDNAIYARHLFLRDRARDGRAALTVELVLVASDAADPPDREPSATAISKTLRRLMENEDVVRHIGIGLLCHDGTGSGFRGRLRRAFPWLLGATRRWLCTEHAVRPENARPKRLAMVGLGNYRLRGTRRLVLDDARVHLIHGPNGSGKSSLVEALELVSTNRVERIQRAGEANYAKVIRHRPHDAPARNGAQEDSASIDLVWEGPSGVDARRYVGKDGIDDPLTSSEDIDASSFRLDQALMDRLIGLRPHERASTFFRAFFPEARPILDRYAEAVRARDAAIERGRRVVAAFEGAIAALKAVASWRQERSMPTREHFPVLLNRWLERTALADLLQRERAVRATLSAASSAGWEAHDPLASSAVVSLGLATDSLEELERTELALTDEVKELRAKLSAFGPALVSAARHAGAGPTLTVEHVAALNGVARWLFDPEELEKYGAFGDKLSRVMHRGDDPIYGTIAIGHGDWTAPLLSLLGELLQRWKDLATETAAREWPGKTPCSDYDAAAKAQQAAVEAGAELTSRFLDRLRAASDATSECDGSLIAALNEVMALFTPARWAYDDVRLPSRLQDGELGLTIELGEGETAARAELHLNTAELNLFTVALFFLCALRVPKPLGLLLLDDPLQNMDEVTSTTLARGLAKIVRLWASLGRDERVLMLFHGFDDVQRFRDELGAVVYRLPWLSTHPEGKDLEIRGRLAADPLRVQSVAAMLDAITPEEPAM